MADETPTQAERASRESAARTYMLSRLKEAARAPFTHPNTEGDREREWLAAQPAQEALDVHFTKQAEAVGTTVLQVPSWEDLPHLLGPWLKEYGVQSLVSADLPTLTPLNAYLTAELAMDVRVMQGDIEEEHEAVFSRDCALTVADEGIADTGSLVFCSKPEQPRVLSLVTPLHVAVLEKKRLHAGLAAYLASEHFDQANPPTNLVMVSGSSRTGDIELRLTMGVHGPKTLLIALIGD